MINILKRLRQENYEFNLPCNEGQLSALAYVLAGSPSSPHVSDMSTHTPIDDLLMIYRDHNGMPFQSKFITCPIRTLSIEEAIANNSTFVNFFHFHDLGYESWFKEQYLFWTDDNSNYMGVFLQEPLRGNVFFLDHEDIDCAPCFRSVHNFYEALLMLIEKNTLLEDDDDDYLDWPDLETDFPHKSIDLEHHAQDLLTAETYLQLYNQESESRRRRQAALIAMNVLPFDVREPLVSLADDHNDMWIQAQAIDIFALRKDEDAIDQIESIIQTNSHNARSAGIRALGEIGTEKAALVLSRFANNLKQYDAEGYAPSVLWSLQKLGFETKHNQNVFSYRNKGDTQWIDFYRRT